MYLCRYVEKASGPGIAKSIFKLGQHMMMTIPRLNPAYVSKGILERFDLDKTQRRHLEIRFGRRV